MFDGINNWSVGGRGIGTDISAPLDIQNSTIGEMSWDITPLVQSARFRSKLRILNAVCVTNTTRRPSLLQSSDFTVVNPQLDLGVWI